MAVKSTLNWTSCPVIGLSPPVVWPGLGLMPPGWTELSAVKLLLKTLVVKVSSPAVLSRLSNATSDGELARVGTLSVEKGGLSAARSSVLHQSRSGILDRSQRQPARWSDLHLSTSR